jgi:Protein of unknown function (DUF3800)
MSAKWNKKVLCFIDEHGTPNQGALYFGIVTVLAIENGRLDKCFSDQLDDSAKEIHAAELNGEYLKSLMKDFHQNAPKNCFTLINRKVSAREGSAPFVYACGLIDAVKIGISTFREEILKTPSIHNVEVIIDRNSYNTHKDFEAEISKTRSHDNRFKAVTHIAAIDSAASRMLQLADIAAYSRKFINDKSMTAKELNRLYGIQTK